MKKLCPFILVILLLCHKDASAQSVCPKLDSSSGSDTQVVCINVPITDIIYQGGSPDTVENLPPGVTFKKNGDIVTISGTPSVPGDYNYIYIYECNVELQGPLDTSFGKITVNAPAIIVQPIPSQIV